MNKITAFIISFSIMWVYLFTITLADFCIYDFFIKGNTICENIHSLVLFTGGWLSGHMTAKHYKQLIEL